jgi:DNA-binding MarR family transcriptional regulator
VTPTPPDPDADLALQLRTAVGRLSRQLRDTAAGSGLTPTETSVLFTIVRRGPLGMSELAEAEDLNPTMLSRVVSRLTAAGLVERSPDPADRRVVVAAATDAGVALRKLIQDERAAALGRELDRLDDDERSALAQALPALAKLATQLKERRA